MALKKKIQCKAISNPTNINFNNDFTGTLKDFFENTKNAAIKIPANNILNHTKASADMVIKAPNMAVKPQIKTIK
jgi:hypothetical protein